MKVALMATDPHPTLVAGLREAGLEIEALALPEAPEKPATAALTEAFRDVEHALAGDPPGALLVTGDGDTALGGALVAVKLGVPTAWLPGGDPDALVGRVADLRLDATSGAVAIAAAIRELAAPRITAP